MSMGITQMNSLLSSANTLKGISNLNASRTLMNGQSRILTSEIKADKGKGIDTKDKEESLADMQEQLQDIEENMSNSLTELNERIEADNEKIREEEVEQARQAEKAADSKTETPTVNDSGDNVNMEAIVSGITEPIDTVEISPEAKAAAAADAAAHSAHTPASPAPTPAQSTGKAVDAKV